MDVYNTQMTFLWPGYLWFLLGDCWLMYKTCDAIQRQRFLCRLLIGSWLALLCVCVVRILRSEHVSCSLVSDSLWPLGLYPTRLLCPKNSPGKNTGLPSHSLLQGIFQPRDQTQVSFAAKSLQSCLTLCDPMDSSLLGSSVRGILQARILEWVAISSSQVSFPWSDYV